MAYNLNFQRGAVIPEYSSFLYLTEENVYSLEASFEKGLSDANPWNRIYGQPSIGASLFFTTLGNDEVHGQEIAIYPYFLLPISRSEKFETYATIGLGLGYTTKIYDPEENPLNVVVGSHINVHFQTKLGMRFRLSEKFFLDGGVALAHLSNANTAEPNIGINNGTYFLGLHYRISQKPIETLMSPNLDLDKSPFYEIAVAPGFKSTRALKASTHFTFSVTGDVWKPLTHVVAIGIGPDIFYDGSAETELSIEEGSEYEPIMQWSTGLHLSVSFRYDRLRLILQGGVYVGLPNEVEDELIYNRGMVRYDVTDQFIAYFAMKSHLHILDHPEFGLGYRFGK